MSSLTNNLLEELAEIIEKGKKRVVSQVNSTLTLVYWQVGYRINTEILKGTSNNSFWNFKTGIFSSYKKPKTEFSHS